MSKKGLIASLVLSVVVALALGVYTLVAVFGVSPKVSTHLTVNVAVRYQDEVEEIKGYNVENGNISFECEGEMPLEFDAVSGKYTAKNMDSSVTALISYSNGDTKTVNVKTYKQGDGLTENNPYVIANVRNLIELREKTNTVSVEFPTPNFVKFVEDIDLSGYNWIPIGLYAVPGTVYGGTSSNIRSIDFDGHSVSNITISINETNYEDYIGVNDGEGTINLGLFGYIAYVNVKNVGNISANITISKSVRNYIDNDGVVSGGSYSDIKQINAGALSGQSFCTTITGKTIDSTIVTNINGFSYKGGIGGVVGLSTDTSFSTLNVRANIVSDFDQAKGTNLGGVVGHISQGNGKSIVLNKVSNVKINFIAYARFDKDELIGAVAGRGASLIVEDVNILSEKLIDSTVRKSSALDGIANEDFSYFGGVVGYLINTDTHSIIKNVVVNNLDVSFDCGWAAGVVGFAGKSTEAQNIIIENPEVYGSIKSVEAAAIGIFLNDGIVVKYTKAYASAPINIKLIADKGAGLAYDSSADFIGFDSDNKTKIIVDIKATGADYGIPASSTMTGSEREAYVKKARFNSFSVGLIGYAYKMGSESYVALTEPNKAAHIVNFDVTITARNGVNYAGLAFKSSYTTFEDIDVNANVVSSSFSKGSYSTTYMISGGVCLADAGTILGKVNANIVANKNVNKSLKYGATYFGGLVARYNGDDDLTGLGIFGCEVNGDVYFNYTPETVLPSGEGIMNVFIAGGVVGAFHSFGTRDIDDYNKVSVEKVSFDKTVYGATKIGTLNITVDMKFDKGTKSAWVSRAIGAVYGVMYTSNTSKIVDISTVEIENSVVVTCDQTTFSYVDDQSQTHVLNGYVGVNNKKGYGSTNLVNETEVDAVDMTQENRNKITYYAL